MRAERIQEREIKTDYSKEDIVSLFEKSSEDYQYLLPRTGFDVAGQTMAYLNSKENFEIKKGRIEADIRHFVREYIDQEPVLVNPIQIKDGQVVSVGYGEIPMTSYVNKDERNGASFQETEIVSRFLPQSPTGTMFVSTSPEGTTGVTDFEGNMINHPETQTKVYYKNPQGNLEAFTFRSKMSLQENVDLMKELSQKQNIFDNEYKTEFDVICEVTGTVVSRHDLKPEDVIEKIRQIKFSNQDYFSSLKKARTRPETDKRIEKILNKLSKNLHRYEGNLNDKQIRELTILIGQTVIEVHDVLRGSSINTRASVSRMSELGGCAGGGVESRKTVIINGEVHYFVKRCGKCGKYLNKYISKGYKCTCGGRFKGC